MTQCRLLVIGIGSRLMKDDGIGPRITDALKETSHPGREVITAETDFSYALEYLRPGDHVVLIDAVQSGAEPASVHVFPAERNGGERFSQHEAWTWGQLHSLGADCTLIGVEAMEISAGFTLSTLLLERFPQICREVSALLDAIEDACIWGHA